MISVGRKIYIVLPNKIDLHHITSLFRNHFFPAIFSRGRPTQQSFSPSHPLASSCKLSRRNQMGKHYPAFILCAIFVAIAVCDGFAPLISHRPRTKTGANEVVQLAAAVAGAEIKTNFLEALDRPYDLNTRSKTRTQLLNDVIDAGGGLQNPGSRETFASVAEGTWKVCYAPHMTIMFGLFQGEVSVQVSWQDTDDIVFTSLHNSSEPIFAIILPQYDLRKDGTTTSKCCIAFGHLFLPKTNALAYLLRPCKIQISSLQSLWVPVCEWHVRFR